MLPSTKRKSLRLRCPKSWGGGVAMAIEQRQKLEDDHETELKRLQIQFCPHRPRDRTGRRGFFDRLCFIRWRRHGSLGSSRLVSLVEVRLVLLKLIG